MSENWSKSRLKIPRYILSRLIQEDKKLYKAILIYLDLKPLFYSGVFKDAKNRAGALAGFLRISKRNFHYKIKLLEERGFISWDKNDLILCSWIRFFELNGIKIKDPRSMKFYRLKNNYDLDLLSRVLIIQENFKKQEKVIERKIFTTQVIEEKQIKVLEDLQKLILSELPTKDKERLREEKLFKIRELELQTNQDNRRELSKLKRSGLYSYHYTDSLRKWFHNQRAFNHSHRVNFDISVSCKKVAQLFGLTAQSTGYYWECKLQERGYLKKEPRSIFIPNVSAHSLYHFRKSGDLEHHYFEALHGKGIFKRLNNQLILISLVTA